MSFKVPNFWFNALVALVAAALLSAAQCASAHAAKMPGPMAATPSMGHSVDPLMAHHPGHAPAGPSDCCDSSALSCCVDLQVSPASTSLKIEQSLPSLPFWPLLLGLPLSWGLRARRLKTKETPPPIPAQTPVSLRQVQLN